jgi:hypothetical protein
MITSKFGSSIKSYKEWVFLHTGGETFLFLFFPPPLASSHSRSSLVPFNK